MLRHCPSYMHALGCRRRGICGSCRRRGSCLQLSALAPRARGRRRRAASGRRDYAAPGNPAGAFIPTEQSTPVARYRRLRRAGRRRPCRHYRPTDADAHAVAAAAVSDAFANADEKIDSAAQSRAHAPAKPCAHQASEPAAHKPAHASAETDGVLPLFRRRPAFFSSATLAPPPCSCGGRRAPRHRCRRRGPRPTLESTHVLAPPSAPPPTPTIESMLTPLNTRQPSP
jgi:hypothetical protein